MPPNTLAEAVAPHLEFQDGCIKGGNRTFVCTHFDKTYIGLQTRQLAHLLGIKKEGITSCSKISEEDRAGLKEPEKFAEWVQEIASDDDDDVVGEVFVEEGE